MRTAACLALTTTNAALSRSLTARLQHFIPTTTTIESASFCCYPLIALHVRSGLGCFGFTSKLRAIHPLSLCAQRPLFHHLYHTTHLSAQPLLTQTTLELQQLIASRLNSHHAKGSQSPQSQVQGRGQAQEG